MSAEEISISSSAFYLAYVFVQLPAGMLVDKYGIKKIMIASTLIFSIAIFIASIATTSSGIILYRALAGLGGGFAFLCAIKSASLWLPDRLFPLFIGLTQFFLYLGATLSAAPLVIIAKYFSVAIIMSGVFLISVMLFLVSLFIIKMHPEFDKRQITKKRKISALANL